MTATDQPPDPGRALHHRLLNHDPTASAEITAAYFPALEDYLRARFPWVADDHLLQTAATDAFRSYLKHPQQYDPAQRSLAGYLQMAATGDLLNLLKQQQREATRTVKLDADGAEETMEDPDALTVEERVAIAASPV